MKNLLLALLLLFSSLNSISAQNEIKGIGLIVQPLFLTEYNVTESAALSFELSLYEKPGVLANTCISRKAFREKQQVHNFIIENESERPMKYDQKTMIWTGYKAHSLQVYEQKGDYLKVEIESKSYWLKLNELAYYGMEFNTWRTYFAIDKTHAASSPINNEVIYNMNLRDRPTAKSKKITLIKVNGPKENDHHQFRFTGNYAGNWAEIEVYLYDDFNASCSDRKNPKRKIIGWVKYLDDKGFPNVIRIPTPCC